MRSNLIKHQRTPYLSSFQKAIRPFVFIITIKLNFRQTAIIIIKSGIQRSNTYKETDLPAKAFAFLFIVYCNLHSPASQYSRADALFLAKGALTPNIHLRICHIREWLDLRFWISPLTFQPVYIWSFFTTQRTINRASKNVTGLRLVAFNSFCDTTFRGNHGVGRAESVLRRLFENLSV